MTLITYNTIQRASSFLINHMLKKGEISTSCNRDFAEEETACCVKKAVQTELRFKQIKAEEFERQEAKLKLFNTTISTEFNKQQYVETDSEILLILWTKSFYGDITDRAILSLKVEEAFTPAEWWKITRKSDSEVIEELSKTCMVNEDRIERAEIPKRYIVEVLIEEGSSFYSTGGSCISETSFTHIDLTNMSLSDKYEHALGFLGENQELREVNLTNFKLNGTKTIKYFFHNDVNLRKVIGFEKLDFDTVINAEGVYENDKQIEEISLKGVQMPKVESISDFFSGCVNLRNVIGLNEWNPENVKKAYYLFEETYRMTTIDLSGWKPIQLESIIGAFSNCKTVKITLPDLSYVTEHCVLTHIFDLFYSCNVKYIEGLDKMIFKNYKEQKVELKSSGMFTSSSIKDKKIIEGFSIMEAFKPEEIVKKSKITFDDLLTDKVVDLTYWSKFMTEQQLNELASELYYSPLGKNEEGRLLFKRFSNKKIEEILKQKKLEYEAAHKALYSNSGMCELFGS